MRKPWRLAFGQGAAEPDAPADTDVWVKPNLPAIFPIDNHSCHAIRRDRSKRSYSVLSGDQQRNGHDCRYWWPDSYFGKPF
jgi:hypothetical protein